MAAHCFFPIVSLPGTIVLTTGSQFPAHQLTLSTALGRPCSKFEVESRARPTAFEECNGSPSKGREKKNGDEKEENGVGREQDKGRGQQACGTHVNEIVRIANTPWRRRGLCHEQDTLPSHLFTCSVCLPLLYLHVVKQTSSFSYRVKMYCMRRCKYRCKCKDRSIRRGVGPNP